MQCAILTVSCLMSYRAQMYIYTFIRKKGPTPFYPEEGLPQLTNSGGVSFEHKDT